MVGSYRSSGGRSTPACCASGASLSDLEWTINAYNLAFASLMLTAAALGDRFGRKRVYIAGLALFTRRPSPAPRGQRGRADRLAGGAGRRRRVVLPLSLTDQRGVPAGEAGHRDRHLGRHHRAGGRAGPLLGGAIIQGIGWQWIFWINVPVGVGAAVASAFMLTESRGPRPRLDLAGLPLITSGCSPGLGAGPGPVVGWGSGEVIGACSRVRP